MLRSARSKGILLEFLTVCYAYNVNKSHLVFTMKILQTTAGSLLLALAYGVQCDAFRNIIYFDQ